MRPVDTDGPAGPTSPTSSTKKPSYSLKSRRGYAARGLCWQCGREPARPNMLLGEKCAEKFKLRVSPRRKCRDCPKLLPQGSRDQRCPKCAEKQAKKIDAERCRALYHDRLVQGLCGHCGGPKDDSHANKSICRDCVRDIDVDLRRLKKERVTQGLCANCCKQRTSNDGGGKMFCRECLDTQNAYSKAYRERKKKRLAELAKLDVEAEKHD